MAAWKPPFATDALRPLATYWSAKLVCDVYSGYEARFECGVRNTTDSHFRVVSDGARLPLRVLDRPAMGECRPSSAEQGPARATCGFYPFFFS